ncbi:hypothetical protein M885DRAFT_471127 [Pelagophyceae sp. CCMP2097]|nr:hypothetical protein M885DRAFT_471127 [Pelagophyceae sp. CCMP2097]
MPLAHVPDELVAFAHELADAARRVILVHWRQHCVVENKVDEGRVVQETPVTLADRASELVMRDMIQAAYPAHAIVGEEYGPTGDASTSEWAWVLDPIDGTSSFVSGKPTFGTLIALLHRGEPVLGVIDQCVNDERWVGQGRETTLNGKVVHADPAAPTDLASAMLLATTPHMFGQGFEMDAFELLRSRVKRCAYGGDCYNYALLASGFGPHVVAEADLEPYDYLAVVPVLVGAGAVVTDWKGRPLTLAGHKVSRGRVLAASNAQLHAAALKALNAPAVDKEKRQAKILYVASTAVALLAATVLFVARHQK